MPFSRRTFVKGSAAAGGGAVVAKGLWAHGLETVHATEPLAQLKAVEDSVPTTCWIGKQDCGMLARRIDGRVVKFDGHPANPRNEGTLCPKGQAQISAIYDPNRVKTPLVRTNGKGKTGKWREASWDEALQLVADEVNEVRTRDSKSVLWQKGRSKAKAFYDEAFVDAIECSKLGHGAYCSDAGYRAQEYTTGLHGVHHPDMEQTNYLLAWGWNITNAGGNKFCWLTWPRQMVKARERGMKIVHIDPRLRGAGPFADEWAPIRPATDLAMALALCHVLIDEGFVDRDYLATYTNAPYLVSDDGRFVRDGDRELVWDGATDAAVPAGQAQDPQLEGTFDHAGDDVRPAFELFKEHVSEATPEWAAEICGLDAGQIRKIGHDFGENARIGATTVVDGVDVPYRPVAIMAYHMAQQELGFQASRAMTMVTMLVGAVGAAGGQFTDFKWSIHDGFEDLDAIEISDPPSDFTLKGSKYYPINSGLPGLVAQVMNDPDRFGVEKLPEVAILHMVNPLGSFPDQATIMKAYEKLRFVAVISPWLSETADYYADVVLPAATIEKYEGPISATDQYIDAKTMRLPPMDPLFDSKGEIDIYLDLTEKMGVLTGEGGYLDHLNEALELEAPFLLDVERKPTPREILDTWSRFEELEGGIEFFEKNGVWNKGRVDPTERYGYLTDPPFGGAVHRLYGESLLGYRERMQELGVEEAYWQDYTALPTWRPPTMEGSPDEFDLYLIGYKQVENKQSRSSFVPLLAELAPVQHIDISPAAARERGIDDRDEVWVESNNSVTGETRKLKTVAWYTEGIRPDTVAMPHHFGLWTHPNSKDTGPSPNEIMFTGEGYTTNTADQSFHVKVRVTPT